MRHCDAIRRVTIRCSFMSNGETLTAFNITRVLAATVPVQLLLTGGTRTAGLCLACSSNQRICYIVALVLFGGVVINARQTCTRTARTRGGTASPASPVVSRFQPPAYRGAAGLPRMLWRRSAGVLRRPEAQAAMVMAGASGHPAARRSRPAAETTPNRTGGGGERVAMDHVLAHVLAAFRSHVMSRPCAHRLHS